MKKLMFGFCVLGLFAGCKTTDRVEETHPVSWSHQQAFFKRIRDPRVFGMGIYDTPTGAQIRGGGRLHPSRGETLEMKAMEPLRPVVQMVRNLREKSSVLLDITSSRTWLEFGLAQSLRATPLGERNVVLTRLPGEEVEGCLSVVSALQLRQLFIEHPLLYVRMADGYLGSLARGIEEPGLTGVIGWDLLKKFEQVRFLYSIGQVTLFTTEPYTPDPSQVVTTLELVSKAGICAVRGRVNGKEQLILLDPAGDFEVASSGGAAIRSIQLGEGVTLKSPVVSKSPGGVRVGAYLLQKYDVTLCPQEGVVYFESHPPVED